MPREDTQFKPGQSGNPAGRPKSAVSVTAQIKRILREEPDEAASLARALLSLAKEGNAAAIKEVMSRTDGPVPVPINVSQLSNEQLLAALESAVGAGGSEEGAEAPEPD